MKHEFLLGVVAALGLGIQTSICPCPMATNLAAVAYVGRRVGSARKVFLAGLLYTAGRTMVYLALAVTITTGLLSAPGVSLFLQRHVNRILGPLLILIGLMLFDRARWPIPGPGVSEKMRRRVDALGLWGAGPLGMVFALAFCPVSAAWFFALLPLSVRFGSRIVLPLAYGLGTGLPVLAIAVLLASSARWLGTALGPVVAIERYTRAAAAVVFLVVGIYFSLRFVFELF